MWKFHDFSITQILREITFWESTNANSAILTHLVALNFDFDEFLYVLKASKIAKTAVLALLHSPNVISRKI